MTIGAVDEKTRVGAPAISADASAAIGLTGAEANRRLHTVGPNAIADVGAHALGRALGKFWSPVPWMLEGAIALELAMGKFVEAAVIGVLLVFNAALSYFQEGRAQATLVALKSRLAITASVRRDGIWKLVPAADLVPGDAVKLTLGALVPADAKIQSGEVLLDQSLLTGESAPVEAGDGAEAYAGALIRRGEAVDEVSATGARTKFGRTAELVRTAHVVSTQQSTVFRVVRNIAAFNGVLVLGMTGYAYFLHMPIAEIVPLILTAVLASIPSPAGNIHARSSGRRTRSRQARRAPDATFRRGRSRNNGRPVRRQDRHADAKRTHRRADKANGLAHRSRCALGRGIRKRRRRTRSRGPRDPRGRRRERRSRQIQAHRVRAVRSGQADVRGDGYGLERREAAHREGRIRNRDGPRRAVAVGRSRGEGPRNRRACA